jgi:hypothetical protein
MSRDVRFEKDMNPAESTHYHVIRYPGHPYHVSLKERWLRIGRTATLHGNTPLLALVISTGIPP